MTLDQDPHQTKIRPGEETLVAACCNLVLSRKQAVRRGSQQYLDGNDMIKVMKIVQILAEGPAEAEAYGRPNLATDTIPTVAESLESQLGDTARRALRNRLDGQQPVPEEH